MEKKDDVINVMVDTEIKNKAMEILKENGYTMTEAITLYLKEIIKFNGIPFKIVTEPDKKEI